ncbi:uncharacterized protein DSM5745_06517 [Aspergillus mulundensis]|uniref:Uncharacterized protein n=1 Tax=Aspergillus mulundensis TaxID=1810919 RepID=A0A3D8RR91_9EURO|nr:hypothetical protein DSM5745_06517 [Aspergillus mulundensis]RDW76525.1 hypothetical protein DSM5745_06517 [Aspergillus mulundensis]
MGSPQGPGDLQVIRRWQRANTLQDEQDPRCILHLRSGTSYRLAAAARRLWQVVEERNSPATTIASGSTIGFSV